MSEIIQPNLFLPPTQITVPSSTAVVSPLWDALQERAFNQLVREAVPALPTVGCAPTGFGKTKLSRMLLKRIAIPSGMPWVFYTHRKALFSQTAASFVKDGIQFGCRASGYETDLHLPGQMAMIPTERTALTDGRRGPHKAKFVLVDEAHANADDFCKLLIEHHAREGAIVIGLSATPIGIGHIYKHLSVLATNSELRKAGGILLADCRSPTTVDLGKVAKVRAGSEFNQKAMGKHFAVQQVVGQVYDHWKELNPHGLPALLFAPGVKESMWFVDQFLKRGVKAAHIDGDDVYLGEKDAAGEPKVYRSNETMRDAVKGMSERGEVQIVCNRFVFREGVDWPHLWHGIFATAFATEQSWIQSAGRILRAYPGYTEVMIQDHGGNCDRPGLGSPNADREWALDDTDQSRAKKAAKDRKDGKDREPMRCPDCHANISFKAWNANGNRCPKCKRTFKHSVRWVQQTNGKLEKKVGSITRIKRKANDAQRAWDSMYWSARKSANAKRSSTFNQLLARFGKQHPHLRVVLNERANRTEVVHIKTGERTVLANVPAPSSNRWDWRVREVSGRDLQGVPPATS